MAGFFSRIVSLIKSNANDAVSKLEDPSKMLNQVILEMNQSLVEAKKQVAVAIADEKRLAKQLEAAQLNGKEWEKKAMMAVRAGDDGLAREALNRKVEHDKLTTEYQKQHQLQKDATDKLKTALRGLQGKIDDARRKKDLLLARQKRAEAQQSIQKTLNGLTDTSAFDTFDRMSQKVDQLEAEAEAQADLQLEQGQGAGGLDDRFARLEALSGTDDALAALKAKMGLAPAVSAPQLEQQQVRPQVNVQVSEPASVGSNRSSSTSGDLDF